MPFQRESKEWPIALHLLLLLVFATAMVGLWMMPVIFTGLPLGIPELSLAKKFLETGLLPLSATRLSPIFIAFFAQHIAWLDFSAWSLVAAGAFSASLFPWWGSVVMLFNRRIAWVATVILAMMPIYWLQAMILTYYSFSFFFLFLAFFLFLVLRRSSLAMACIASGISFGICIAVKDTFIIFLPWFTVAYFWIYRKTWCRAIVQIAIFGVMTCAFFSLPIAGQVFAGEAMFSEKLLTLLPIDRSKPSWDHFYPDEYTYEFDREWFDAQAIAEDHDHGLLDRLQNEHRLVSFGLVSSIRSLRNGVWFTLGTIPDYFLQDYVGGVVLWLFILPGAFALYKRDKRLLLLMLGLSASMTFIIRFLLHFERSHLMNDGWILACLAAIGICSIADTLAKSWKKIPTGLVVCIITVMLAVQMLQANRVQLARMYAKTSIPEHLAITAAMVDAPANAVIALPSGKGFAPLVDRKTQVFRPETVARLLEKMNLPTAFAHYRVTHVLGYDVEISARIARTSPKLVMLSVPQDVEKKITVTPLMEFLLHIFR